MWRRERLFSFVEESSRTQPETRLSAREIVESGGLATLVSGIVGAELHPIEMGEEACAAS